MVVKSIAGNCFPLSFLIITGYNQVSFVSLLHTHIPGHRNYLLSLYIYKDYKDEGPPRGADWEVVSLTASTYSNEPGQSDTSNALFMSGHFVFPPSEHENLPLQAEILGGEGGVIKEQGDKSYDGNWKLPRSHGIPFFDEKSDTDLADSTALPGFNSPKFHSFDSEPLTGDSNIDDEDRVLAESMGSSDPALGSRFPRNAEQDNYDESGLPYAAWLKKQAATLYSHAKETNTFWSIFIAAAVMGLVIIGQQWQQERWKVLHHKWHSGVYDEKFGRLVGPISRFKDVFVGGSRRGFFIRGSTSRDL